MRDIPKRELGRKSIHYLTAVIPLIYYFFVAKNVAVILLAVAFCLMIIAELMRWFVPSFRNAYNRVFGYMTREREHQNHLTGATYVCLGSLLVVFIFPKEIAVVAMLFLSVGDPSACLVGIAFGNIHIGSRTLEGTLAFITSSLLVSWWIPGIPFWIKAVGAVVAGGLELMHNKIDDNLLIPSVSALVMFLLV